MKETVISRKDLAGLLEYSISLPTGQTIGKRWRRNSSWHRRGAEPEWMIGEYVDVGIPRQIGICWTWAVSQLGTVHRGHLDGLSGMTAKERQNEEVRYEHRVTR